MLTEISVSNFKSFKNRDIIRASKINLFTGANSSGKSTILQAILLIKQTLQYGADSRPLAINGPILRLGSIHDLCSRTGEGNPLKLGFKFDLEHLHTSTFSMPWLSRLDRVQYRSLGKVISVNFQVEIESDLEDLAGSGSSRLNGKLKSVKYEYTVVKSDGEKENLKFEVRDVVKSLSRDVNIDARELELIERQYPNPVINTAFVEKCIPQFFGIHYESSKKKVEDINQYLFSGTPTILTDSSIRDESVPVTVINVVKNWCDAYSITPLNPEEIKNYSDLNKYISSIFPSKRGMFHGIIKEDNQESALSYDALKSLVSTELYNATPRKRDGSGVEIASVTSIGDFLISYFKDGVHYLGPLREPPRPVYQPEAMESFTNVGYRGEHTAAVIEINKGANVYHYRPPSPSIDPDTPYECVADYDKLEDALQHWLLYLGVATSVFADDSGVYGNRLQVSIQNPSAKHDLTNVGVGVSQVLPILVSTLLAPATSLLIFEQPELHLHPRVQSRLADFFISAAQLDKHLIIETHSEYIIDRLRLRIAQSNDDKLKDMISINFVQQKDGVSKVSPIEISEYGVIKNWPDDFFDHGERDSALIIEAARSKRKRLNGGADV